MYVLILKLNGTFCVSEQLVYIIKISFDLWVNHLILMLIRLNGSSVQLYQDGMENSQTFRKYLLGKHSSVCVNRNFLSLQKNLSLKLIQIKAFCVFYLTFWFQEEFTKIWRRGGVCQFIWISFFTTKPI